MFNSNAYDRGDSLITHLTTPMGAVSFRLANIEDAASLLALRLEALMMHPESFATDVVKTAADGERAWVERIREYTITLSGAIMLALAEDELIGMSGIVRGHWPKTRHTASLWGVYVKPTWRGYKVGEAIVNGCIRWGIENGLSLVTLGVNSTNTSAIRCYTRCGFKEYGIEPKAILYDGQYYDDLLMVKLI